MADFPQRVGFWGWIDGRGERREARHRLLIERGLDARSLARLTFQNLDARLFVAFAIIGLFAWAFARESETDTRNLMVGALIAAFAGAWGYYLGSSASAHGAEARAESAQRTTEKVVDRMAASEPQPEIELGPGESRTIGAAPEPSLDQLERGS